MLICLISLLNSSGHPAQGIVLPTVVFLQLITRQSPSEKPDVANSSVRFSSRWSQFVSKQQLKQTIRLPLLITILRPFTFKYFSRVSLCLESFSSRSSEALFRISVSYLRSHFRSKAALSQSNSTASLEYHNLINLQMIKINFSWESKKSEINALVSRPNIVFYITMIGLSL